MCLAIPSEIIKIDGMNATVDVLGARRVVNLFLMPEEVTLGDFVLVHAGFAIQKVDDDAAREALMSVNELVSEMERAEINEDFDPSSPPLPPPPKRPGDFI